MVSGFLSSGSFGSGAAKEMDIYHGLFLVSAAMRPEIRRASLILQSPVFVAIRRLAAY